MKQKPWVREGRQAREEMQKKGLEIVAFFAPLVDDALSEVDSAGLMLGAEQKPWVREGCEASEKAD